MSWPDDGLPRYVVVTVTGFVINPAAGPSKPGSPNTVPPPSFAILDRAYAHMIVAEFRPKQGTTTPRLTAKAAALCAELNLADSLDDHEAAA